MSKSLEEAKKKILAEKAKDPKAFAKKYGNPPPIVEPKRKSKKKSKK